MGREYTRVDDSVLHHEKRGTSTVNGCSAGNLARETLRTVEQVMHREGFSNSGGLRHRRRNVCVCVYGDVCE